MVILNGRDNKDNDKDNNMDNDMDKWTIIF